MQKTPETVTSPPFSSHDLLLSALLAQSDTPHAKDIAKHSNADAILQEIAGTDLQDIMWLVWLIKQRYDAVSTAIKMCSHEGGIVEINASLSPRGMTFCQKDLAYTETGAIVTSQQKREITKSIFGKYLSNLRHFPVDIHHRRGFDRLEGFFNPTGKIVIVCEDLWQHLNQMEQRNFLNYARERLQKNKRGGTLIISNLASPERFKQSCLRFSQIVTMMDRISQVTKRGMANTILHAPDPLPLFKSVGFRNVQDMSQTSLAGNISVTGESSVSQQAIDYLRAGSKLYLLEA